MRRPETLHFRQFYLACLAHASYLIGSRREAVVVDPRRDVDDYLREAAEHGLRIRYVVETHLHADFVSGHRELSERTGAEIVFGARADVSFPHRAVGDGDEIRLGAARLRFLETPGHTPESICVLVFESEEAETPRLVLTGDTLFIGDVGRPDLVGARDLTPRHMAGMLYDSLHSRLLTLPDEVAVYPAHGAGSLCGRNISCATSSSIGEQRRTNYALQPMSRERFVALVTADLPERPRYFARDVALNRDGAAALGEGPPAVALSPAQVAKLADAGACVLDVRASPAFATAHLPASLNLGLQGQFASWAGTLLDPARPVVVVADDDEAARQASLRLARVGLENVAGYLDGGIAAWDRSGFALERIAQITVGELARRLAQHERPRLLDVRRPAEFAQAHVPGALSLPLDRLHEEFTHLDPAPLTALICAGGYRSSAAASLLAGRGVAGLLDVVGGTAAWIAAGYETEGAAS